MLTDVHPAKKAPLTKRASVDDIATYSVEVPDGEVKINAHAVLYISCRIGLALPTLLCTLNYLAVLTVKSIWSYP